MVLIVAVQGFQPHNTVAQDLRNAHTKPSELRAVQLVGRVGVIPTPEELLAPYNKQRHTVKRGGASRALQIQLDSVIRYNVDSNALRIPYEMVVFALDENERWAEEIKYLWDNGSWSSFTRTTQTYDQNGNLVLTMNESFVIGSGWEPSLRTIMSYNGDDQLTKVTNEAYDSGTWIGSFSGRQTYFYDDDLMTEYIFEGWDTQLGWNPHYRVTYSYDADGRQTESFDYDYDAGTWSVSSKNSTTYNAQGHRIKYETFYMDNGWEPIQRFEYTLDGQGLDTLVIAHFYYNGTWDLDKRTRNEFNASGALTSSRYDTWNINTSEWDPFYHTTYTFDQSNRQIESTVSSNWNWSGSFWNTVYEYVRTYEAADEADTVLYPAERGMFGESTYQFYSAFSGNPLELMREDTMYYSTPEGWIAGMPEPLINSEFAIYPNPANDKLQVQHLSGDDINAIDVLDAKGILVKRIRTNDFNQIDVSECPPGVYFMKVSHDTGKLSVLKWIKN